MAKRASSPRREYSAIHRPVPWRHQRIGLPITKLARLVAVTSRQPVLEIAPDAVKLVWYAYEGDRLVLGGGLSAHKHVFKSELKSG
jgi:hypothetical protein